jgi:hypothetical protein
MFTMNDKIEHEKLITPIGAGFVELIVPYLMKEAFGAYAKRDFTKPSFQVSPWENSHAGAAIVLTAVAIEAYRNRIYYLEKEKISASVPRDIGKIFARNEKLLDFPGEKLESIVSEVFIVRDVVVHSHIYELHVALSHKNWDMVNYTQQKLNEYGDSKFERSVNLRTGRTRLMGFDVQPLRIGFEDLFKVLLVFDLFAGIAEKALGRGYVSVTWLQQSNNCRAENLSQLLTCYYDQVPNQEFIESVENLSKRLRRDFASFLSDGSDCFITSTCPKCFALGFHKQEGVWHCNACGVEMGWDRMT